MRENVSTSNLPVVSSSNCLINYLSSAYAPNLSLGRGGRLFLE